MTCRLLLLTALTAIPVSAGELAMPTAQQNALVAKYCTVCHSDPASNGGLSLEHFDAAQAPPSLLAMLLSKVTGGAPLAVARAAASDAAATASIEKSMKTGAMGAAGIPRPDRATTDLLIRALTGESSSATEWNVERTASEVVVSTAREALSTYNKSEAEIYRVIAECNQATREGYLQVAWSPVAHGGTFSASVDGHPRVHFEVEEREKNGYGHGTPFKGLASVTLEGVPLPARSLVIGDLFPGQTVTFPFADIPRDTWQALSRCFEDADLSKR